ncbi:GDP-mannose 4,6-dehydratase [Patescibacteria group bacterium]|nr:GDP-mannose 4,6-dehydratase [Patescibacteria group bacterium]
MDTSLTTSGGVKRALVTGITGQDGSYLAEFLLSKGYEVHGLVRRSSHDVFGRLVNVKNRIHIHYGDLRDIALLERVILKANPDEVYNLGAQSHVGISFECPEETYEINYKGMGHLVHVAMRHNPKVRIYQASTSEMFGSTNPPQAETSPMNPVSPYGEAKLKAHEDYVVGYRQKHGLFICSGFLFNHESPRRGEHFVTRKTSLSFAKISLGQRETITLGNLDAKRDWGFAGDYVEMMWLMLQQDTPDDYVIGTGESHSVRELVEVVADAVGLNITWEGEGVKEIGRDQNGVVRVMVDEKFYRPREVNYLLADITKAREKLGWVPKTTFHTLVTSMVRSDIELLQGLNPVAT